MASGEDEPIAVDPLGVGGVVAQELGPEGDGRVGHAHGHTGVARVGLLHGIGREKTDGIGREAR